jgi:hypothetical protein|nr:hypothetical protein [Ruminococcus sp. 1001270H_150608_F2]
MLSEQDSNVLIEIADMLDISISVLEHYPTDLQQLLITTFLHSKTVESARERLKTVIDLSMPEKESPKNEVKSKSLVKNKDYLLTRQTIINNAKIIKTRK